MGLSISSRKSLNFFGAVLAVISTLIGGGVVGIPYAYYYCGIILGIGMNLFVVILTIYSTYLYLLVKDLTGGK